MGRPRAPQWAHNLLQRPKMTTLNLAIYRNAIILLFTIAANLLFHAAQAGPRYGGGYVVIGWNVVSRSCLAGGGAQESITYKVGDHRWLWTASAHYDAQGNWLHNVNTVESFPKSSGWQDSWRSRAGHFGEFWYGQVVGYHWTKIEGADWLLAKTFATDCNIGAEPPDA